jgi:hypothetical protein
MHMRLATPGPRPRQRRASPTSLGPQWMIRALRGAGVDSQAPARMLARSCLRVDLPFRVPGTGASAHHPRLRGSLAEWQPTSVGMRGANPPRRACPPGGRSPGLSASAAVRRRALLVTSSSGWAQYPATKRPRLRCHSAASGPLASGPGLAGPTWPALNAHPTNLDH